MFYAMTLLPTLSEYCKTGHFRMQEINCEVCEIFLSQKYPILLYLLVVRFLTNKDLFESGAPLSSILRNLPATKLSDSQICEIFMSGKYPVVLYVSWIHAILLKIF